MVEIRPKNELFGSFWDVAKWKTLLRYISVVSFISIVFAVVKLRFLKVFCIDSASKKWPSCGDFGSLLA